MVQNVIRMNFLESISDGIALAKMTWDFFKGLNMKLIIMFLLLLGVMVYAAAPSGSQDKSQIQPTEQEKQEEHDRMEKLKYHTREDDPKVQGDFYNENQMKYQTDEDSSKEGEI